MTPETTTEEPFRAYAGAEAQQCPKLIAKSLAKSVDRKGWPGVKEFTVRRMLRKYTTKKGPDINDL